MIRFMNPSATSVANYAIVDPDPLNFMRWIMAFDNLYKQIDSESTNYHFTEIFVDDLKQYVHHLLSMAPFNRIQVSLYNLTFETVCTTRELQRLNERYSWADGTLPESFVALMREAVQVGFAPKDAMIAMKEYGTLITLLATNFVGNDRRRLLTIPEAQNIVSLLQSVANAFADQHHVAHWVRDEF